MAKFDLDGDFVRKLAGLLDETSLAELEYSKNGETIRLSRQTAPVQQMVAQPVAAPSSAPHDAETTKAEEHKGFVQTSPMVGTIYLKPTPSSPAYVSVGDHIKAGAPICQIEAMKVFTQITAERDGTISDILINDGAPVEFEQPLFVIS